jgi:hypothetical protein
VASDVAIINRRTSESVAFATSTQVWPRLTKPSLQIQPRPEPGEALGGIA